jgi:hypothetical protein
LRLLPGGQLENGVEGGEQALERAGRFPGQIHHDTLTEAADGEQPYDDHSGWQVAAATRSNCQHELQAIGDGPSRLTDQASISQGLLQRHLGGIK